MKQEHESVKLLYELEGIKEALELLNGQLEQLEKKVTAPPAQPPPPSVQVVVTKVFHEKIAPSLDQLSLQLDTLKETSLTKRPFRTWLRYQGVICLCAFLSCLLGAVLAYSFMPAKSISPDMVQKLYYGTLLTSAWPHLSDDEKTRLYDLSSQRL